EDGLVPVEQRRQRERGDDRHAGDDADEGPHRGPQRNEPEGEQEQQRDPVVTMGAIEHDIRRVMEMMRPHRDDADAACGEEKGDDAHDHAPAHPSRPKIAVRVRRDHPAIVHAAASELAHADAGHRVPPDHG
ncbi:MAG: hypothetical protein QOD30_2465, partial [Actinomycetota bacterium]|nr:hypothetical protein [Actinomycetota bacterium]